MLLQPFHDGLQGNLLVGDGHEQILHAAERQRAHDLFQTLMRDILHVPPPRLIFQHRLALMDEVKAFLTFLPLEE